MTYDQFQSKWLGKKVNYDGAYGYQCVDLVLQYAAEVFGLKTGVRGNAIDYWRAPGATLLTKFSKVGNSEARKGDIVIFNGINGNPYGHIGIATGKTTSTTVEVLEQNGSSGGGSGTGNDAIRVRAITRSRVPGILRPIPAPAAPTAPNAPSGWRVGDLVWLKGSVAQWRVYAPGVKPQAGKEKGFIKPANYYHGPNGQRGLTYRVRELTPYANTVGIDTDSFGRVWIYLDNDAVKV